MSDNHSARIRNRYLAAFGLVTLALWAVLMTIYVVWGVDTVPSRNHRLHTILLAAAALGAVILLLLTVALIQKRRDRAQDELARARLAAVVDGANDAIVTRGLDGNILTWNAGAERLFGYTAAEVTGRDMLESLSPPETVAESRRRREKSLSGVDLPIQDTLRITKDGRRIAVSVVTSPLKDNDGVVIGSSIVYRDIGERKRAEAEHARLAAIVESASDAVIARDLDGTVLSWNPAAEQMFGYTAAEMIGQKGLLTPPELQEDNSRHRAIMATGGRIDNFITERITRDGRRLYVSTSLTPIKDAGGRAIGFASIIRDITERRRTTLERQRLVTIIENASVAISSRDFDNKILSWNAAAEKLFGFTAAEAIGQTDLIAAPENLAQRMENRARLLAGESVPAHDTVRMTKDGRRLAVSMSASPTLDDRGNVNGYALFFNDLSDRVAAEKTRASLEAQVRESQKMEALGTLAGGIAHDFNNILGAISGNLTLAREDLGNNARALESIDEAARAAERAKSLVKQILTFSRREAPEFRAQPVRPLIDATVRMMRATLPQSVRIESGAVPDSAWILANESQISQVLLNLCTNAWHAMPEGKGTIHLEADAMHFNEEYVHHGTTIPAGQYVRIAVKDNGTGIDPAIQPRIFEPFFTTKLVGQGTGLGLSVAHGIIHSHNGYIALQSAPGAGSTFEIFLPASSAAEPAAAAPAPPATAIDGGRRMVYIDDDEAMRFMVVRLLSRRGFNVSAFESGAGALAAVTADPDAFDFVITDYNMPQQSGIEVARALREIRPNLPIMLISGYITDEMREDARQIGIQRVLEKQNSIAELVDAIIASLHP